MISTRIKLCELVTCVLVTVIAIALWQWNSASGDVLFLSDGRILHGEVVSQNSRSVKFRFAVNEIWSTMEFPLSKVEKLEAEHGDQSAASPTASSTQPASPEDVQRAMDEMNRRNEIERAIRLERDLNAAKRQLESQEQTIVNLRAQIVSYQVQLDKKGQSIADLERQLAMYRPTKHGIEVSSVPEVLAKELEIKGKEFLSKRVKMVGCEFNYVTVSGVSDVPGVFIDSNGLLTTYNASMAERILGFAVTDRSGNTHHTCFASKEATADFFIALKRGTKLNIEGTVVQMRQSMTFGLICDRIEVAFDR